MKTNPKKQYDFPMARILEIKFEGIVCGTGDGAQGQGNYGGGTPIEDSNIDDD